MSLERFSWIAAAASIAFALVVASGGAVSVTAGFIALVAGIARAEEWIRGRLEDPALRAGRVRSAERRARDYAALLASLRHSGTQVLCPLAVFRGH